MITVNLSAGRVRLFCLALLMALSLSARAENPGNGKKLYVTHCAGCHGENGISVVQRVPNLARFELVTQPSEDLAEVVRAGRGTMPPYFGILNDEDVLDVVNYLRKLY